MPDPIMILELGPDHLDLLFSVRNGLFDNPIRPDQAETFLNDPGHLMFLAMQGEDAVGMASAVINNHPDKAPILFGSEVRARDSHQRQGIATKLSEHLLAKGTALGCEGAWLATKVANTPARKLYQRLKDRKIGDIVVYDWGDSGEP
ncbi:GNAT family N-acetyltransferase [Cognatiyoonia sp.]|uniref:GNAT family N-acetyltransferase n=1 Tax=Cognatiyoonia sp. TaxID=2211652 RepID=UPI003F69E6BA